MKNPFKEALLAGADGQRRAGEEGNDNDESEDLVRASVKVNKKTYMVEFPKHGKIIAGTAASLVIIALVYLIFSIIRWIFV